MLNIVVNILTSAGLEIRYGFRQLSAKSLQIQFGPFCGLLLSLPIWLGMAKVLLLIDRDKAQSVEEYRAKRRFKQGGQK
jgi:hypothetical protein